VFKSTQMDVLPTLIVPSCTSKNRAIWSILFSMTPEYLKTDLDEEVNNYRDWGNSVGAKIQSIEALGL